MYVLTIVMDQADILEIRFLSTKYVSPDALPLDSPRDALQDTLLDANGLK